jgi:hypothetical protein
LRLGFGESDTTHPSAGLQVNGTISSGAITAVGASGTSVVQNIRNPSTSWSQYALTRYGTEGANYRYMDFGYYRGASEATRGLVIKSQANATKFTFLDSGDFQIGTTTVIDSSTNATFATLDLGTSNTSGKPLAIQSNNSAHGTMRIYRDSTSQGETGIGFFGKSNASTNVAWIMAEGGWGAGTDFVIGNENGGAGGNIRLQISRSGNVNVKTGALQINGTTVIDSSRNIDAAGVTGTEGTFGTASGNNVGVRLLSGTGTSDYARIRYYEGNLSTNRNTIHFFGRSWQGGGVGTTSTGAINIDGDYGVTFGAWNAVDAYIDTSGIHSGASKGYYVGTTQVIDASRNLTNIASLDMTASATANIHLNRSGFITFYGNSNTNHGIGSRSSLGSAVDDIRINSYGAVYVNLDSNSNNSSGADFVIGRHGSGTGTITTLVTVSGEDGDITTAGTISIGTALPFVNTNSDLVLNDKKLYLRGTGDTNHYLWNNASDWEELVAYTGTGFKITSSTGYNMCTFGGTGAVSMAGTLDVAGKAEFQGTAAIEGGTSASGYGLFKGYSSNYNHFIGSRCIATGSRSSPTLTGGHQMTFVEFVQNAADGFRFKSSNTSTYEEIAYINRTGISTIGNVTAYASDKRLKTNIKPIKNALEKLSKIRGVEYDWVDNITSEYGFEPSAMHETGVIAQEIEKVIPDAVSEAPMNEIYTQRCGTDHQFLTVQKDKIVPLLIEAVKEQQKEINELKTLVKQLLEK